MKDFFTWDNIVKTTKNILTWKWVESLFHWILTSGGTLSGIIFLVSGVWLSIAKSVPDFIHTYVDSTLADLLTYLAKTAFTSLPEVILFLATIKTLEQIKLIRETGKGSLANAMAWLWTFLFGVPALIFITFSLTNIGLSLSTSDYTMPDYVVIGRGLTCFVYALLCFVYESQGKECFASKLREKKAKVKELEADIEALKQHNQTDIDALKQQHQTEIEALKQQHASFKFQCDALIIELKSQNTDLENQLSMHQNEILQLSERASSLELGPIERNFPSVKTEWLDQGIKSVTMDEIRRVTGLSKDKIKKASLRKAGRNGDLLLVSSVIDWLRTLPGNGYSHEYNGFSNGHNQDTDTLTLPVVTVISNN